jgi:hypothetical protein
MKIVTRFESNDGHIWDSEEKAIARDKMIEDVKKAMRFLPEPPSECDFANGGGYIDHTASAVFATKSELIELSRPFLGEWMERQTQPLTEIHASWFGRLLDGGHEPLERAWSRMMCITPNGREFGQPYYAEHPDEAKQVCIANYVGATEPTAA